MRNGALLARAAGQFDIFVTVDRNLAFQQRIDTVPFAIVVLRARTNRLVDLQPLIPQLLQAILEVRPGEVRWVGASEVSEMRAEYDFRNGVRGKYVSA